MRGLHLSFEAGQFSFQFGDARGAAVNRGGAGQQPVEPGIQPGAVAGAELDDLDLRVTCRA